MKFIPNAVTRKLARQLLLGKKHSPTILFGLGVAGVVTSTVLACKATLKLDVTLNHMEDDIRKAKSAINDKNFRKTLTYAYAKGSYDVVKLYGPSILLGSASIAMLTGSHVTLTRRNASLTAAYVGLTKGFEEYRDRVREELGAERENDIHLGLKDGKVMIDGKNQAVKISDPNRHSIYARFFDEGSVNWQKNPELNRIFVQCQNNYANHLLHARGHVFLNEVYDMLGIDRSSAGQFVGWVMGNGDNYIDFGVFEVANSDFVNGYERTILLDFNVDGVIHDLI